MKKLILLVSLFPMIAFAEEPQVPEALGWLLGLLSGIPSVGPYIMVGAQWAGALVLALTALSGAMMGLAAALELALHKMGYQEKAEKIKGMLDKVIYYLKYLSMFNAKK